MTQTPEDLLTYAIGLADADGVVLVMPPRVNNNFEDGNLKRTYTFTVYIYRFAFTGPDTGMNEFETLWEDLDTILKGASITGIDDCYLDEWVNLTDRHKDFCWGKGTIILEDWVV